MTDTLADAGHPVSVCSVNECERLAKGKRGWCGMHTERWRRWGDPTETRPRIRATCAIEGCEKLNEAQGWCALHYRRWREYGDPLHPPHSTRVKKPALERLLKFIDQSAGPDACWPWTGRRTSFGYGHASNVCLNGRQVSGGAHRLMYAATHGPIPNELLVLHACNNPPCCNPAHLRLGTQVENMADRRISGAGYATGNDAPTAIQITPETVAAIRAAYMPRAKGRGQHALAQKFGLSRTTVQRIVTETDRWGKTA